MGQSKSSFYDVRENVAAGLTPQCPRSCEGIRQLILEQAIKVEYEGMPLEDAQKQIGAATLAHCHVQKPYKYIAGGHVSPPECQVT